VKVGVVGCGIVGPAVALLLTRDGHDVEVFERSVPARATGAGFLLQRLGQLVVEELGLGEALRSQSATVRRVHARARSGRVVLDFGYDDVVPGAAGWGVNRETLCRLLVEALSSADIPLRTEHEVERLSHRAGRWWLDFPDGESRRFDLVIGADGARSKVRRQIGAARKDVGYPYGALWSVVPDPEGIAGDVLHQRYADTRITLGILPVGIGEACIYWSVPNRKMGAVLAAGPAAWVAEARPHAGHLAPLVDRAANAGLIGARYRDVVVTSPFIEQDRTGVVLVGDAAHAMSPQLGLGASIGLADAWTLAACLRDNPGDLRRALSEYADERRAHVRWYTWCSRLLTPAFQSDLVPLGWLRDALLGPIGRVPWVRGQFVTTFMGIRTSPWTYLRDRPADPE
jgi:2-polyprenyl-6-methoxyphenol hydroxylase-like FAD-dependent oxidoreductase